MAELYRAWGKDEQAEPLYKHALAINEQQLGTDHPLTDLSLGTLARLYAQQRKYAEAESSLRRALSIRLPGGFVGNMTHTSMEGSAFHALVHGAASRHEVFKRYCSPGVEPGPVPTGFGLRFAGYGLTSWPLIAGV